MTFKYCPDCGSSLIPRNLGDEIGVPWCVKCSKPWFPVFPTAVIALVYDNNNNVLLIRQNYISTEFHNLVSGYLKPGESAEECAFREIKEETGIDIDCLELKLTRWFAKKEILMIGFFAHACSTELSLSSEVDSASWYPASKILELLSTRPGSTSRILAEEFLKSLFKC